MINDIKRWYQHGDISVRLIIVHTLIFVAIRIGSLLDFLFGLHTSSILKYLMLPALLRTLVWQLWSLVSYIWIHDGIFHYAFNMIGLYVFGTLLSDFMPRKNILPAYLLGGISGGLVFLLAYNLFPVFKTVLPDAYLMGASAAVMSLLAVLAAMRPNYGIPLIFGVVSAKYVALAYILVDILTISSSNPGGHLAHLGGMLFGFVYARQGWYAYDGRKLWKNIKGVFVKSKKPHITYKRPAEKMTVSPTSPYHTYQNHRYNNRQEQVDAILDKIAQDGYDSLSADEKAFLFKVSQDTSDTPPTSN